MGWPQGPGPLTTLCLKAKGYQLMDSDVPYKRFRQCRAGDGPQYRGCSVTVAHDIWDVVEGFDSHIFYQF